MRKIELCKESHQSCVRWLGAAQRTWHGRLQRELLGELIRERVQVGVEEVAVKNKEHLRHAVSQAQASKLHSLPVRPDGRKPASVPHSSLTSALRCSSDEALKPSTTSALSCAPAAVMQMSASVGIAVASESASSRSSSLAR